MIPISGVQGPNPFKMSGLNSHPISNWKPLSMQDKGFADGTPKMSFEQTMNNMVGDMDKSLKEPEQLLNRYLTVGDIDVHDVMMANAKSDITINVASQVATKIIQAYERVQQIQV